jgi:uncharacterized protein (DUF2062 family)
LRGSALQENLEVVYLLFQRRYQEKDEGMALPWSRQLVSLAPLWEECLQKSLLGELISRLVVVLDCVFLL